MKNAITSDTISLKNIEFPTTKTINWDPDEYKITKINTEKGMIEFEKIKDR